MSTTANPIVTTECPATPSQERGTIDPVELSRLDDERRAEFIGKLRFIANHAAKNESCQLEDIEQFLKTICWAWRRLRPVTRFTRRGRGGAR